MDRTTRYEVLHNEEEDVPAPQQPVMIAMVVPPAGAEENNSAEPPSYSSVTGFEDVSKLHAPVPPSYNVATDLPSYDEAERTKAEELLTHPFVSAEEGAALPHREHVADVNLGTDGMFLCTFILSFLFNWLGFLVCICLTNTLAGRYGALAGFGLSMVKWVAIVKHNNWTNGIADIDAWLWWLLILLGFLIFFRGCFQYIRVKYQWDRLSQAVRNHIYYYL